MKTQAGQRLEVGTPVQVGNLRGAVVGHIEPQNFNQVVAHKIKFTERKKTTFANRFKWEALSKAIVRGCNYSFISYAISQ